jgi:hypothetical protein
MPNPNRHDSSSFLRLSHVMSPNTYEFGELPNSISLGSATCWARIQMSLASCHIQYYWDQLHVEPKYIWVWWVAKLNILRFSYMLSSNTNESGELPYPILLRSITCWAQIHMSLANCQPNILGFNHALSINRRGSSKLSGSMSLGSTTCWAQTDVSLTTFQTRDLLV